MTDLPAYFLFQLLQISWLDLLLSGDNAVVIAMACRDLPERQKKIGVALGAAAAVALRVLFTVIVDQLLKFPYIKLIGGILLLGIAVKLVTDESEHAEVKSQPNLWGAVTTIVIADGVMSLDNVLAILGVAHGDMRLIIFGLLLSIPLVVFGAGALMRVIDRFPILIWAGAALLGWVAGEMIVADPVVADWLDRHGDPPDILAAIAGMIVVLAIGGALTLLAKRRKA